MRKHIDTALKILSKVFSDGTYSNMAFYGENVSDMATRLVYGVLENNVKIEYILSCLLEKKPQNAVYYLLKIGVYALLNLDDVPKFAIVSECVEVAKENGKGKRKWRRRKANENGKCEVGERKTRGNWQKR